VGVGLCNRGNDGLQIATLAQIRKLRTGFRAVGHMNYRARKRRPEIALDALNQCYALGDIRRTD